jgi:hypothetical protein
VRGRGGEANDARGSHGREEVVDEQSRARSIVVPGRPRPPVAAAIISLPLALLGSSPHLRNATSRDFWYACSRWMSFSLSFKRRI